MIDKSLPKGDRDVPKYKMDHKGQLEIDGIDTPLGEKSQAYMKADAAVRKAQEVRDKMENDLMDEMKKSKIRSLNFSGNRIQYQAGKVTAEKIKFTPLKEKE